MDPPLKSPGSTSVRLLDYLKANDRCNIWYAVQRVEQNLRTHNYLSTFSQILKDMLHFNGRYGKS